jgi:hypothetical protein
MAIAHPVVSKASRSMARPGQLPHPPPVGIQTGQRILDIAQRHQHIALIGQQSLARLTFAQPHRRPPGPADRRQRQAACPIAQNAVALHQRGQRARGQLQRPGQAEFGIEVGGGHTNVGRGRRQPPFRRAQIGPPFQQSDGRPEGTSGGQGPIALARSPARPSGARPSKMPSAWTSACACGQILALGGKAIERACCCRSSSVVVNPWTRARSMSSTSRWARRSDP